MCYEGPGRLAQLQRPPAQTPEYLLPPSEKTHFKGCESRLAPLCSGLWPQWTRFGGGGNWTYYNLFIYAFVALEKRTGRGFQRVQGKDALIFGGKQ